MSRSLDGVGQMSIPQHIIDALNAFQGVEAPLTPTLPGHNAWVVIRKIYVNPLGYGPKFGEKIKPNAQYIVQWLEMSERLYNAYLQGSDVTANDAEKLVLELVDDEGELEQLLLNRLSDLSKLVPRPKNPIKYP